jgi:flagellar export protein FliJ
MKKFSLKRVRELRTNRAEQVAAELAKANHAAHQADAAHEAVLDARVSGEQQIAELARHGATVGHLHALSSVLDSIDVRLADAQAAMRTARQAADRAQELHTLAAREQHVLDRLYERHLELVRMAEAAQDRTAMDAAALTRFTHRDSANPGGEGR